MLTTWESVALAQALPDGRAGPARRPVFNGTLVASAAG
jgi:hypothetical protein